VVLESIHRCREEGDGRISSAIRGTREVRSAVMASTLTSIAVFFPMVFVEGVAGQAFGDLGIAVVVSLLASVVVALYFIPMLASRGGVRVSTLTDARVPLLRFGSVYGLRDAFTRSRLWTKLLIVPVVYWLVRFVIGFVLEVVGKLILVVFMLFTFVLTRAIVPLFRMIGRAVSFLPLLAADRTMHALLGVYPQVIRWALAHRFTVFAGVAVVLWATWQLGRTLDTELLPEVRQGEFTIEVALPVGTPLEETEAILEPVEAGILAEREAIDAIILTLGYDPTQSQRSDEGEHTARFKVLLKRGGGAALEDQVVARLRQRFRDVPDLTLHITRPVLFSSRTPIEVEVQGDDLAKLKVFSDRVQAELATLPELTDVTTTLLSGRLRSRCCTTATACHATA